MSGIDWRSISLEEFSLNANSKNYASDYLGVWELGEDEKNLIELSKKYHKLCDDFDKRICTGKSEYDDSPMPATPWQRHAVTRNASQVLTEICCFGESVGLKRNEIIEYIRNYGIKFR